MQAPLRRSIGNRPPPTRETGPLLGTFRQDSLLKVCDSSRELEKRHSLIRNTTPATVGIKIEPDSVTIFRMFKFF